MKSFNIDLETVEGLTSQGAFVEVQGAMTVAPESQPLEGVHQSSLRMSMTTAAKLHGYLQRVLDDARRKGITF